MEVLSALQYLNNTTLSFLFIIGGFVYFFYFKPKFQTDQSTQKIINEKISNIPSRDDIEHIIDIVVSKIDKPNYELLLLQFKEIQVEFFEQIKDVTTTYPKLLEKLEDIDKIMINIQSVVLSMSNTIDEYHSTSEEDNDIEINTLNDIVNLTNTIESLLEFLIEELVKKKVIDEFDKNKIEVIKSKLQLNRTSANSIIELLLNSPASSRNKSKLNKIIGR